jgi:hypothetical protein
MSTPRASLQSRSAQAGTWFSQSPAAAAGSSAVLTSIRHPYDELRYAVAAAQLGGQDHPAAVNAGQLPAPVRQVPPQVSEPVDTA